MDEVKTDAWERSAIKLSVEYSDSVDAYLLLHQLYRNARANISILHYLSTTQAISELPTNKVNSYLIQMRDPGYIKKMKSRIRDRTKTLTTQLYDLGNDDLRALRLAVQKQPYIKVRSIESCVYASSGILQFPHIYIGRLVNQILTEKRNLNYNESLDYRAFSAILHRLLKNPHSDVPPRSNSQLLVLSRFK